jgi:DNA-binding protein HU-beta
MGRGRYTFGLIPGTMRMSKADFVEAVAKRGNLSKADAKRAIELVFGTVEAGLKAVRNGGRFPIGTFGTFIVARRRARMGRNPKTGEAIKVKASRSLRFKPSGQLRDAAGC